MDDGDAAQQASSESALIEMAVESWRFSRVFLRLISKLDAGEGTRYVNQLRYFQKRIEESLDQVGLKLVNVEGQYFDPGVAATALNVADFSPDDRLIINQMIEPIIMGNEGLKRQGTVMVGKVEK
jgi:hypothetical protein